ncbi:MAG: hypothetical protein LQ349_009836, partial [Xanthoria aureola]
MASDPAYHDETMRDAKDLPISDPEKHDDPKAPARWWKLSRGTKASNPQPPLSDASSEGNEEIKAKPNKWSMGIMSDPLTDEVP